MRRTVVLAGLTAVLAFSTAASAAEVRFPRRLHAGLGPELHGALCRRDLQLRVSVRPSSAITRMSPHSANSTSIRATSTSSGSRVHPKRWLPVAGGGIDNLHYSFRARIYLNHMAPAVITPSTALLDLVGFVENMGNDPGVDGKPCIAGFRGAYFRPPDRVRRAVAGRVPVALLRHSAGR